jgi:hypothetical protein
MFVGTSNDCHWHMLTVFTLSLMLYCYAFQCFNINAVLGDGNMILMLMLFCYGVSVMLCYC